jgi:dimeric dUTPase (all-alpha-NTP-PPase superfamily)
MSEIVLDELFTLQKGLDEEIHQKHHVDYATTHYKRILALLVELGEFANETRCFKFWSVKPASEKEVILDEYADGMHFFLSLGIPLGVETYHHTFVKEDHELTLQILKTYALVSDLLSTYDEKHYALAFSSFLNLLPLLGYSGDDAIKAYKKKLAVNYQRQEQHY